jgi:hypothetical protein
VQRQLTTRGSDVIAATTPQERVDVRFAQHALKDVDRIVVRGGQTGTVHRIRGILSSFRVAADRQEHARVWTNTVQEA